MNSQTAGKEEPTKPGHRKLTIKNWSTILYQAWTFENQWFWFVTALETDLGVSRMK